MREPVLCSCILTASVVTGFYLWILFFIMNFLRIIGIWMPFFLLFQSVSWRITFLWRKGKYTVDRSRTWFGVVKDVFWYKLFEKYYFTNSFSTTHSFCGPILFHALFFTSYNFFQTNTNTSYALKVLQFAILKNSNIP